MSPTQRSLAYARKLGWTVQVVEKWNQWAGIRQDLFGCIDLVACTGTHILAIQATSRPNVSERLRKAVAEPRLLAWLESGGEFEVWGWGKGGERGKRKHWQVRICSIDQESYRRGTFASEAVVNLRGKAMQPTKKVG